MTASDLSDALEGRREGHEWRCRCPVHGGRSLCVTEKNGRILLMCRAGCSQGEVISELKRLGLWGSVTRYEDQPPAPTPQDNTELRANKASEIWDQAHPIETGDPVHTYLKNRGIIFPKHQSDLKTHPALPYWEMGEDEKPIKIGVFPCMLAIVRNPQGKPVGLHRTYITSDGHKAPVMAPKKLFKVYDLSGSSVRLFSPQNGLLAVTEGIEDALSAMILWQIPAWAVLGTSGMKGFIPPENVQEVMILSDNDESGRRSALELAQRLENKGKAVRIRVPSGHTKDINQILWRGQDES